VKFSTSIKFFEVKMHLYPYPCLLHLPLFHPLSSPPFLSLLFHLPLLTFLPSRLYYSTAQPCLYYFIFPSYLSYSIFSFCVTSSSFLVFAALQLPFLCLLLYPLILCHFVFLSLLRRLPFLSLLLYLLILWHSIFPSVSIILLPSLILLFLRPLLSLLYFCSPLYSHL
jgi:hypothetical protein